jgi:hypothetical protein
MKNNKMLKKISRFTVISSSINKIAMQEETREPKETYNQRVSTSPPTI